MSLGLSDAGILGAIIGLIAGVADYAIVVTLIGRALNRASGPDGPDAEGRAALARHLPFIKTVMLVTAFIIFPLVGYFIGVQFAT